MNLQRLLRDPVALLIVSSETTFYTLTSRIEGLAKLLLEQQ